MSWLSGKTIRLPGRPPCPPPEYKEPARFDAPSKLELAPSPLPPAAPVARPDTGLPRKESLIADDLTIEGKIEGGGSVRIAGNFKGDVNVQGDLTIEAGAKLTGGVRADKVTIAGELEGNVEEASRIDLLQTGVVIGDLKAGSLTVAAGARMRGKAEFGWDDGEGSKAGKHALQRGDRRRLMSSVRPGSPGATRECPHCRETILESAGVCPACRHYLRFDARRRSAPGARAHAAAHRRQHPASRRRRTLGIHGGRIDPQRSRRGNRP